MRSPFRCYLECIRQAPRDASHVLIVQDDAWPCDNFREKAEAFIAEYPDVLVPFFMPGQSTPGGAVRRALKAGEPVARLRSGWVPTVALAWPQEAAQAYLRWAEDRYDVRKQRGDDAPTGAFRLSYRIDCMAPVPSYVEHPDVVDSLFRGKPGKAGANKARVARAFSP